MADNLSAVLYAKDDLRMEQRPVPEAQRGQLLIRSDELSVVLLVESDIPFGLQSSVWFTQHLHRSFVLLMMDSLNPSSPDLTE